MPVAFQWLYLWPLSTHPLLVLIPVNSYIVLLNVMFDISKTVTYI